MAGKKNRRIQLKKALEELDRGLDAEFEDALQATLKAIQAQEQGEYVIGMDEDPDNLDDCVTTRRTILQVEVYGLEGRPKTGSKDVFKGTITLEDKDVLSAQPAKREYIRLFRNLLATPISVVLPGHDSQVDIDPKTNPRGWIINLYRELKSYALRATKARKKSKRRTSRKPMVGIRSKVSRGDK